MSKNKNMDTQKIIERRIETLKQQFYSNRIEGEVDQQSFYAVLERAKEPISDEEFIKNEMTRIYKKYGKAYAE